MELRDKIAGAEKGQENSLVEKSQNSLTDQKRMMLHLTTTKLSLQMIRGRQWFF